MNAMIVARKEIHQAIRNRWVLASTLLLAGLAVQRTLEWVPSPGRPVREAPASAAPDWCPATAASLRR